METKIITIGREHGAGGNAIAVKLSEILGIPYYDKEMVSLTAKNSNISEEVIAMNEQKRTSSFLYSLYASVQTLPLPDQIFIAQSDVIRKLAENGSCIFVGRCADYVLRAHEKCFNVFVYAPLEYRVHRVIDEKETEERNVERYILRKDRERSDYYSYNSHMKWGDYHNYDMMLNSRIGIAASAKLIAEAAEEYFCI